MERLLNKLKGIIPPMITVFHEDESIDAQGTREHLRFLIENGVHGVIPAGSTGEFIAMTLDERKRLIQLVLEEANGQIAVVAGTGDYSTRNAVELSRFAEQNGADAVMAITPYYLQPSVENVMNHYRRIRESVNIPVMLYSNPYVSGYELSSWDIAKLVEEDVVHAVKSANGDPCKVHDVIHLCGNKAKVFYGADLNAPEGLLAGAVGWVTSLCNALPAQTRELYDLSLAGDSAPVFACWHEKILPLLHYSYYSHLSGGPVHWLAVVKTTLHLMGRRVGKPRLPMTLLEGEQRELLQQVMRNIRLPIALEETTHS